MPRIGTTGSVVARAAAFACAAAVATTPPVLAQAAADVSPTDLVVNLRVVTHSPRVSSGLAQGLLSILGPIAGQLSDEGRRRVGKAILNLPKSTTSTMDYIVKIKGNRMRVDMGGSSLLARLAPDGSVAEWGVLDPASGRVMNSRTFDRGVRNANVAFREFPGEFEIAPATVSRESETRTILGYPARRYRYTRHLSLFPLGRDTGAPQLVVKKYGSAWLARYKDVPEMDLALFLQVWARSFNDQGSGPMAVDEELKERGLLLETHDTTEIELHAYHPAGSGTASPLMTTSASTTVTSVDRPQLDPVLFGGFETPKKECNCSCAAYDTLQAIGKLSKKEMEQHPRAMALAMCMPKCVSYYMKCPRPKK